MSNSPHSAVYNHLETITGAISGGTVGVILHASFVDIIATLSIALCTGFLGAAGAHLFKYIRSKITKTYENR